MGCGHWGEMISAYFDGELSVDRARDLEEHLRFCPECAGLADETRRLVAALDTALAAEMPRTAALAARRAFREEASRRGVGDWWRDLTPALKSAACVLAVAGLAAGVFMGNAMTSYLKAETPPAAVSPVQGWEEAELVL